ncbi:hypothetical protein PR202_gb17328 [Eleusine coracana subsp. coracana]|uniref:DUF6598 domain-containing protein n=1 Tax=Eleusine coracana subsp. coracana TaxID=191504 RepID=A0AAV5F2L9_ELECO|nr:hypothetical protein PR202_gb17328 [Eleusine coracana subsp. coracana]
MAGGVVSLPTGGSLVRDVASEFAGLAPFVNEDEREDQLMEKIREIRLEQEEERRRRRDPAARQAERERIMRRVEQKMERMKENKAQRLEAIARIVDYDPKQGGTYFSRLYFVKDRATFNYDEECKFKSIQFAMNLDFILLFSPIAAPLGPMRYSNRIYEKDNYELCEGINIFSLKIATSDVGFPLLVHGTVIARDSIDKRLVYLFNRDGDNCQVVNSKDDSLILIGPKRGLALISAAYVETNLKIKDHKGQDIEFSKGVLEIKGMERRTLKKCELESCSLSTRLSTVDMMYAVVKDAVEATIEIVLLQGEFYGEITASTSSIANRVVLHDSKLVGGTSYGGQMIQLLRSVVCVSLKEKLFVTVVDRNAEEFTFVIPPHVNYSSVGIGLAKLQLKVTWSIIDF